MKWLIERFNEASSHAGIAALAAMVSALIPFSSPWHGVAAGVTGLFGLTAFSKKG